MRDEGEAYAAALTAAGGRAELTVHAGLIHHFYGLGGVIPAAQAAFERVCDGSSGRGPPRREAARACDAERFDARRRRA